MKIRKEKVNFKEKKIVLHLKDEDLKKIIDKDNIVDYIYNNRSKIAYIRLSVKDVTNYKKGMFNKIMKDKKYLSDYIYLDIKNRSENIISKLEENRYCNYDLDKKDIINILKSLKLNYTKKDKKR